MGERGAIKISRPEDAAGVRVGCLLAGYSLTEQFTFLEHKHLSLDEFYVAQNGRSTDFEALRL